jgi:sigma-E factor negative regulatory protein RseB
MTPRNNILRIAGAIVLLTASFAVGAASAVDWLNSMSRAMQSESYTGTYVYLHGDQLESLQINHLRDGNGERERLLSLNGEAREIIRDNNNFTCIWPGSKAVIVSKSRPRTPISGWVDSKFQNFGNWYELVVLGEDRVAGRMSTVIGVVPKDKYRYGHKLWIDSENFLLLRLQMLDSAGIPVEQIMFTQMTLVDEMPHELFTPALSEEDYNWQRSADVGSQVPVSVAWVHDELPAGFQPVSEQTKPLAGNKFPVYHLMLSDGLASVSVYVEKRDASAAAADPGALVGESQIGAISAFGRNFRQFHVTVVGEVPMVTATKIGHSLKLAVTTLQ